MLVCRSMDSCVFFFFFFFCPSICAHSVRDAIPTSGGVTEIRCVVWFCFVSWAIETCRESGLCIMCCTQGIAVSGLNLPNVCSCSSC